MDKGYSCFFWDFDGTLYDSYPAMTEAFFAGIRGLGLNMTREEVLRELKVSVPHLKTVTGERLSLSPEETEAAFRRFPSADADRIVPYAGVKEMLESVTRHGGRNFLYTHRGAEAVRCLKRDGLLRFFADGVTGQDGFPRKPMPDALLFLMGRYGLDPDTCVMMGDRDIDLDAAKRAGIHTCLFDPDGFYPDYPADHAFPTYAEMAAALT